MKGITAMVLVILLALGAATNTAAGDAAAGKAKAALCAACHGPAGISIMPNYPNLACQKEPYLIKAINDYKNGARKEPLMAPMVTPLSAADIENLAAYYSTIDCN